MREGWTKQKLGEVITLEYGKPLPKDERCGEKEGFPAFGANGIKCYAREPYWQHPSIIVGRKGTAGAVNLVEGGFWPLDVTYYVTFDDQKHDRKFLYYMLSALNLPALATGVKPGINRNVVYAIEQYFPLLPEQKRIVTILDEAFAGIDTAIANTEKNLANARELFESYLKAIFNRAYSKYNIVPLSDLASDITDGDHMPPPKSADGVPFITIKNIDKRTRKIGFENTFSVPLYYFNGLKHNRKPRKNDVLYTVTGSYGIPVLIDHEKAFCFQRHIALIRPLDCLDSKWLYYLLMSPQITSQADETATGTAQKTVSLKALRGFQVPDIPLEEQRDIVSALNEIIAETSSLESIYQNKLTALAELKQSLLQKAFSGELTTGNVVPITSAKESSAPPTNDSPAFAAHIMAVAYHWHESQGKNKTFGHVKAQKTLHLVEALAQIDLGRAPVKDAAGPNDFAHMRTAEKWARENDYYDFVQRTEGQRGYDFVKGKRYSEWLARALDAVEPYKSALDRVVSLLMPLDTQRAELVATVYAAWNNLLLDGHKPTEADIVHEARDNWHPDKQQYTEPQFREAIDRLRSYGMVPSGAGKRVTGQESFEL